MGFDSLLEGFGNTEKHFVDYESIKPLSSFLNLELREFLLIHQEGELPIKKKYMQEWKRISSVFDDSFYGRQIKRYLVSVEQEQNTRIDVFQLVNTIRDVISGFPFILKNNEITSFCFQLLAAAMDDDENICSFMFDNIVNAVNDKDEYIKKEVLYGLCLKAADRELLMYESPLIALKYYSICINLLPHGVFFRENGYSDVSQDVVNLLNTVYNKNKPIENLKGYISLRQNGVLLPANHLRAIYNQFFFGGLSYNEKISLVSCMYSFIEKKGINNEIDSSYRIMSMFFIKMKQFALFYYLMEINHRIPKADKKSDIEYSESIKKLNSLIESMVSINRLNCTIPYNLQFLYQYFLTVKKSKNGYDESDLKLLRRVLIYSEKVDNLLYYLRLDFDSLKSNLCYYTSIQSLNYILPSQTATVGQIPIMNTSYMNDPNEGNIIWNYLYNSSKGKSENKERKIVSSPFVFIKSFTTSIDNLPMWKMYGDNTRGCCVVLNQSFPFITSYNERCFIQDYDNGSIKKTDNYDLVFPLYRILYVRIDDKYNITCPQDANSLIDNNVLKSIQTELGELKEIANEIVKGGKSMALYRLVFEQELTKLSFLVKDKSYSYEKEVRYLIESDGFTDEFYYTGSDFTDIEHLPKQYIKAPFPVLIHELILGPGCIDYYNYLPYLQDQFYKMYKEINRQGSYCPQITLSEIDYR